jgi:hypothetical protein
MITPGGEAQFVGQMIREIEEVCMVLVELSRS